MRAYSGTCKNWGSLESCNFHKAIFCKIEKLEWRSYLSLSLFFPIVQGTWYWALRFSSTYFWPITELTVYITTWNVSKYGVFSDPYFPAFGLNTERCFVFLRIQSECGKIRTRKNSVFGHISHSIWVFWKPLLRKLCRSLKKSAEKSQVSSLANVKCGWLCQILFTDPLINHRSGYLHQDVVSKFQSFVKDIIWNCEFS